MKKYGLLLFCALIAAPAAAWVTAQSQISHDPSLGIVEGVAGDAANKPIRDASVYADKVSMPKPARPHTAQTNAEGHFVVDEVCPGRIVMRA